jgi:hypothetical protein
MKSYVEQDTQVVCTNMTVSSPMKLVDIHNSTAIHQTPGRPLLNIKDKKISDTFVCKNQSKLWNGLAALCIGIAVGAVMTAAVVASGGTALLIFAAVAATVGGAFAIKRQKIKAHDCDVTKSSSWLLFHAHVNIDGNFALLSQSTLNCNKGGVVSIVMDPVVAQRYAEIFSQKNNTELYEHMTAQFVEGWVTGITALGSVPGLIAATGLSVYFGKKSELESQESRKKNEKSTLASDLASTGKDELVNQTTGNTISVSEQGVDIVKEKMVPINRALNRQVLTLGDRATALEAQAASLQARGLTQDAAIVAERAASVRLAQDIASRSYRMPWTLSAWKGLSYRPALKEIGKGFGAGIAGAVVNFGLEQWSNGKEDDLYKGVLSDERNLRNELNQETANIGIIAEKV